MTRDDRLYAFIVAHTSRSRARIRRISIHKRWLKLASVLACGVLCTSLYGIYGAFREATHMRTERENARLRSENAQQRQQLKQLETRVDAIEDTSRRLAEMSGVAEQNPSQDALGAGGPLIKLDAAEIAVVEQRAVQLEEQLRQYETALRERAHVPSIWPVVGELNDGFGGRYDPFGGGGSEFHTGQDIRAATGTPVVAAAEGTVIFANWKNGYGQVVEIDHGNGLTTRYGHLSKIETTVGHEIARGELLGRIGTTGRSTGPHLHYEVRINDNPVNPRAYLPMQTDAETQGK
ncbi:MAG: peptidoglycan DD-metalloendopeptidase family protein [Pyrinomonadaceae bacterium]